MAKGKGKTTKIVAAAAPAGAIAEAYTRMVVKNRVLERLLHLYGLNAGAERIREEILDTALDAMPAEAASFVSVDREAGKLRFDAVRGPVAARLQGLEIEIGTGLVGACADSHKTITVSDVRKDRRHAAEIDEALGFATRSLVAVPVLHGGEIHGVIELVNRTGGDLFTRHDIEVLERVARTAGALLALGE